MRLSSNVGISIALVDCAFHSRDCSVATRFHCFSILLAARIEARASSHKKPQNLLSADLGVDIISYHTLLSYKALVLRRCGCESISARAFSHIKAQSLSWTFAWMLWAITCSCPREQLNFTIVLISGTDVRAFSHI